MIIYEPIPSCAGWKNAHNADLVSVDWQNGCAIFEDSENDAILRVSFSGDVIFRLLDEFPLSTEDGEEASGLVPHHFAYRVTGHPFFEAQSEVWRTNLGEASHYQFLTCYGCLDAVTASDPRFSIE